MSTLRASLLDRLLRSTSLSATECCAVKPNAVHRLLEDLDVDDVGRGLEHQELWLFVGDGRESIVA